MKSIDNNRLRELLDRFMEGETTNAEEQEIIESFRRGGMAAQFEEYRPMIMWLAGGMTDEVADAVAATPIAAPRRRGFSRFFAWTSVAASLALMVTAAVALISRQSGRLSEEDYITYAGSYVIKDGVKITDLDEIMPELQRTEQLVEQQRMTASEMISSMDNIVDTSDPYVRAALESAFSD